MIVCARSSTVLFRLMVEINSDLYCALKAIALNMI